MATEWTDRAKAATKAELEANLLYLNLLKEAETAREEFMRAQAKVQAAHAEYNKAVLERNAALVEMMNG